MQLPRQPLQLQLVLDLAHVKSSSTAALLEIL